MKTAPAFGKCSPSKSETVRFMRFLAVFVRFLHLSKNAPKLPQIKILPQNCPTGIHGFSASGSFLYGAEIGRYYFQLLFFYTVRKMADIISASGFFIYLRKLAEIHSGSPERIEAHPGRARSRNSRLNRIIRIFHHIGQKRPKNGFYKSKGRCELHRPLPPKAKFNLGDK